MLSPALAEIMGGRRLWTVSMIAAVSIPSRYFVLQFSGGDPSVGVASNGIADEDIEHAMRHALAIDDQDDDTRLYLDPSRSADLLEVVAVVRADGSELAIHAMKMRPQHRRRLPGG